MKSMKKYWVAACIVLATMTNVATAQKIDDERMKRDLEVAENVLSTLIKQEITQGRNGFFGMDVKGSYLPGYGVTFRLPVDFGFHYMVEGNARVARAYSDDNSYSYTITTGEREAREEELRSKEMSLKDQAKQKRKLAEDSVRNETSEAMIDAAKNFIVDYGDFLSQLGPNEKIIITNQGGNRNWYFTRGNRKMITVEGLKSDVVSFRQGKITRDQALGKLKVVNTESVDTKEPDMELVSSIFGRLYRSDLSKTYYTEDNIYYERLKDYGVVYYMQVYSSTQMDAVNENRFLMPTVNLRGVDQATRDKKVIELYPQFEKDMKENILEYGRTLKSLKDEESLVFNVTLTKCVGCGIPSTVEISVKNIVLKDYATGKLDKNNALSKFVVKQGPKQ